jgi:hypothetical protein
MSEELNLESLAHRLTVVERELANLRAAQGSKKDWRKSIGMFTGSEFMKQVDAEAQAIREADRAAARRQFGSREDPS